MAEKQRKRKIEKTTRGPAGRDSDEAEKIAAMERGYTSLRKHRS